MLKQKKASDKWGEFCHVFGSSPRNRIIEFFLELRGMDYSVGDVAMETGLNRSTSYYTIYELVESGFLVPTRKVSGSQLFTLNRKKPEVSLLITAFDLILRKTTEKYAAKAKKLA